MMNSKPKKPRTPSIPGRRAITAAALLAFMLWHHAAADTRAWHIDDAPLRFSLSIESQPTDPRAGMIAIFPDGGLLPRPYPEAVVMDRAGNTLESECVWFNPDEGYGLVFERPRVGLGVTVYFRPARNLEVHTTGSRFRPGLMVYVQPTVPGRASLEAAARLADTAPPGSNARFGMVGEIRSRNNPLWRDDRNFATYYSGWLKPRRAGQTWMATLSQDGSQVRIDGNTVATWPAGRPRQAGARGQIGGMANLSDDIHRIEYLHFQNSGALEMLLAWRLPGQSSEDLPDEVRRGNYIHSGRAEVAGVESRDGAPLPLIAAERLSHLWLYEQPIYLVRCSGKSARNNPGDTVYTWRIGNSPEIRRDEFLWLVEGNQERTISLSVVSEKGAKSATYPFYLRRNTSSASLDNPDHRRAYRMAFLNMCRLLPPDESPAMQWSGNMWNTLLDVLAPYEGRDLLVELFNRSFDDIRRMPDKQRYLLEDYFFEVIRYSDREIAGEWLETFFREEENRDRRLHWQLTNVDFLLYDMRDTNGAQRIVRNLQRASGNPEVSIRAQIREGDIERLAGNFEDATRIYSRAQDRSAALRRSQRTQQALGAASTVRGADAIRQAREERQAAPLRSGAQPRIEDWRVMAVRGSVHYETTKELIRTGHLFEARDVMAQWELEFPLHKIGEDLLIAEAEYFMTIGNYRRARLLLANYRAGVSMTNFLPLAMQMEIDCLLQLKMDDELRELIEDIEHRLPNHTLADMARNILATLAP